LAVRNLNTNEAKPLILIHAQFCKEIMLTIVEDQEIFLWTRPAGIQKLRFSHKYAQRVFEVINDKHWQDIILLTDYLPVLHFLRKTRPTFAINLTKLLQKTCLFT